MQQIPLNILSAPQPSFDSFEAGQSDANQYALNAVREFAASTALAFMNTAASERVARDAPPLLIWGPHGSGKTHLLQAAAQALSTVGLPSGYLQPGSELPWVLDPAWRTVLLDDCGELDAERQHAAFALLVQAQGEGIPVLAAAHAPPVDLPLREDLRTRLGWGPVFALQALSETERRAVLRREADARGLFLADEVMDYMLIRFERDLGSLMGLLNRMDQYALTTQRRITVPLLRDMLRDTPPHTTTL